MRGLAAVAVLLSTTSLTPAGITIQYGRTPGYDCGTAFDYIVDRDNPFANDGNPGSPALPFLTPQAAVAAAMAAGGAKQVGVRSSATPYAQLTVTGWNGPSAASRCRIAGYGTERPLFGGLVVSGWAVCATQADAGGNANYASIYKKVIAKAAIAHTAYNALALCENGVLRPLSQKRRDMSDLFEQTNSDAFYQGGSGAPAPADDVTFTLYDPGGGQPMQIDTIAHPSALAPYTDAQIAQMAVMVHAYPNVPKIFRPSGVAGKVITLPRDGGNLTAEPQDHDATPVWSYSLLNVLPDLAAGQWAYVDDGSANLTLYYWPLNAANMAAKITIADQEWAVTFNNCNHLVVEGLQFAQAASHTGANGMGSPLRVIGTNAAGASNSADVIVRECRAFNYSFRDRGTASGIYTLGIKDVQVYHNDVEEGQNAYGITISALSGQVGNTTTNWVEGAQVWGNRVYHCSQSPYRIFTQRNFAGWDNYAESCGKGDHSNKTNFYQGSNNCLWLRAFYKNCQGYLTLQFSSNIHFVMCFAPTPPNGSDTRAFVDQTSTTVPPVQPSTNYVINCAFPQGPGNALSGNGLDATSADGPGFGVKFVVANNLTHGIDTQASQLVHRGSNLLTSGAVYDGTEQTATNLELFADQMAGNYNTLPGSLLRTKAGEDVSSYIAALEAQFPGVPLRYDMLGNPWNPAAPGIGPYARGAWPLQVDITAPVLTFSAPDITGGSAICRVTTDEIGGTIYWVRLAQGAATPSAVQIVAGLDAAGAAAGQSGNFAVGATTGEKTFGVTGTPGVTYKVCTVHVDRFGNASAVATQNVAFADYAPLWVAFDGATYLRRATAINGAQATTQSFLIAISHKRSNAQNVAASGGITGTVPSARSMGIDYSTNHRLRLIFKRAAADNVTIFDKMVATQTGADDVEFLTLYRGYNDGAVFRCQERVIKIVDGTVITVADATTALTDFLTWANTTTFNIFRCVAGAGASFERFMLWDNATADITDAAVRESFYDAAGHKLRDPSVAAAAFGAPLISLFGNALVDGHASEGINAGTGGNWSIS